MTLRLFGATFSTASAGEVIAAAAAATSPRPRLVVTANVDHIVTLAESAAFRKAYEGAVARTLDGTPLVWLARLSGRQDARRVTGHDLLAAALAAPTLPEQRIFMICSDEAVGTKAAERFAAAGLDPDAIRVTVPPFGFETDEAYSSALAAAVRRHGTSLLILGVGAPKSEIWVDRLGAELGNPVVLAVGEALNVAAGLVPRAPVLMQRLCLEWLYRFARAPRRLFARYFLRSWRFLWIVASARSRRELDAAMRHQEAEAAWIRRA